MPGDEPNGSRNANPWPPRAVPYSLLVGSVTIVPGVVIAVRADPALGSLAALLLGLLVGGLFIVIGFRRWRAGGAFPVGLGLVPVVVLVALALIAELTGTSGSALALPFMTGMVAGLAFANAGAARDARRSQTPNPST